MSRLSFNRTHLAGAEAFVVLWALNMAATLACPWMAARAGKRKDQ